MTLERLKELKEIYLKKIARKDSNPRYLYGYLDCLDDLIKEELEAKGKKSLGSRDIEVKEAVVTSLSTNKSTNKQTTTTTSSYLKREGVKGESRDR